MPCVYSCMMIPFSRSPSRMPGCSAFFCTLPVVGPAAIAALIAVPSACVTATAGIVTGGPVIVAGQRRRRAARVVGDDERLRAGRLGDLHARQVRALRRGGAAVDDRDPVPGRQRRRVGRGRAAGAGVDERAARQPGLRDRRRVARPGRVVRADRRRR